MGNLCSLWVVQRQQDAWEKVARPSTVKECLKGANGGSFLLWKILAPSLFKTLFKMNQFESNSINALKKNLNMRSMLSLEAKKAWKMLGSF